MGNTTSCGMRMATAISVWFKQQNFIVRTYPINDALYIIRTCNDACLSRRSRTRTWSCMCVRDQGLIDAKYCNNYYCYVNLRNSLTCAYTFPPFLPNVPILGDHGYNTTTDIQLKITPYISIPMGREMT